MPPSLSGYAKIAPILWLAIALTFGLGLPGCRAIKERRGVFALLGKASGNSDREKREATSGDLAKVIETARSYTGTPWLLGGVSRTGIDCSGLVVMSYKSIGKEMPRNSTGQSQAGREVSQASLKPGDLVFFTDRRGNANITHVGLVTEVKDDSTIKFIHTTSKLGVVENNLHQPYWNNLYVKAIRPD